MILTPIQYYFHPVSQPSMNCSCTDWTKINKKKRNEWWRWRWWTSDKSAMATRLLAASFRLGSFTHSISHLSFFPILFRMIFLSSSKFILFSFSPFDICHSMTHWKLFGQTNEPRWIWMSEMNGFNGFFSYLPPIRYHRNEVMRFVSVWIHSILFCCVRLYAFIFIFSSNDPIFSFFIQLQLTFLN